MKNFHTCHQKSRSDGDGLIGFTIEGYVSYSASHNGVYLKVHCAFGQLVLPHVVQGTVRHDNPPGLAGREGDIFQLLTYWAQEFSFPFTLLKEHSPDG